MAAWELRVTDIRQGLVTEIDITAQRKCGRVERLTARQFPAGWRMNTSGIPARTWHAMPFGWRARFGSRPAEFFPFSDEEVS